MDCTTCCATGIDEGGICEDCHGCGWTCPECCNPMPLVARIPGEKQCRGCVERHVNDCPGCDFGTGDNYCRDCNGDSDWACDSRGDFL